MLLALFVTACVTNLHSTDIIFTCANDEAHLKKGNNGKWVVNMFIRDRRRKGNVGHICIAGESEGVIKKG